MDQFLLLSQFIKRNVSVFVRVSFFFTNRKKQSHIFLMICFVMGLEIELKIGEGSGNKTKMAEKCMLFVNSISLREKSN